VVSCSSSLIESGGAPPCGLSARRPFTFNIKWFSLVKDSCMTSGEKMLLSLSWLSNAADLKERGVERRDTHVRKLFLWNIEAHRNAFGPWCRADASLKDDMKQLLWGCSFEVEKTNGEKVIEINGTDRCRISRDPK